MKSFFIIFLVWTSSVVSGSVENDFESIFANWMGGFKKCYADKNETSKRFENFMKEYSVLLEQEEKFKNNQSYFRMKLNKRSGDSLAEKSSWHGFSKCHPSNKNTRISGRKMIPKFDEAPESVDFRQIGYVTDPEDQGYCGSCYAFASICALEGQLAKKYGSLISLSKQHIIDCSFNSSTGNWGCDGGYAETTFDYIRNIHGVARKDAYPYDGEQGRCRYEVDENTPVFATGYNRVYGDEENLKRALAETGPMIVAVKADMYTFYGYSEGIYDDNKCIGNVNHAVCLVGYGTDYTLKSPVDYWIIKNSWSDYWGENGYMRILRGKNLCNITDYAVYPIVYNPL